MKMYKICIVYLFVFYTCINLLSSQCGNIELKCQAEINGFINKYGKCKTINNLIIRDFKNDILQFDSLYHIERIDGHFELQTNTEKIKNLDGFGNLKFVNDLFIFSSKLSNSFVSLDTINHLRISSSDTTSYRAVTNVKYIKTSIWFSPAEYCMSNNLGNFKTGTNFSLTLRSGSSLSCLQRLSKNIETKNLKRLNLMAGDHILSNLNFIDSLESLIISSSIFSKSDFTAVEKLTNLRSIKIEGDIIGNNDYGVGFKRTYHLDTLILNDNKKIITYFDLFPNLQTIRHHLYVIGNDALIDLEFLKDVMLPNDPNDTIEITIQDNKLLNDCNVTFLCEALTKFPESVIIQNNGAKCTKEEILKYCKTVNTHEIDKQNLIISPNPTHGYVRIENLEQPVSVTIFNLSGQIVKIMNFIQHEINIEDLPQGMYIIEIRNKEISERHKIVKVE